MQKGMAGLGPGSSGKSTASVATWVPEAQAEGICTARHSTAYPACSHVPGGRDVPRRVRTSCWVRSYSPERPQVPVSCGTAAPSQCSYYVLCTEDIAVDKADPGHSLGSAGPKFTSKELLFRLNTFLSTQQVHMGSEGSWVQIISRAGPQSFTRSLGTGASEFRTFHILGQNGWCACKNCVTPHSIRGNPYEQERQYSAGKYVNVNVR